MRAINTSGRRTWHGKRRQVEYQEDYKRHISHDNMRTSATVFFW